jgi:hypothetical protein
MKRPIHSSVVGQLLHERVLFEDGGVAPAAGPVELDDDGLAFFAADAVHAVFVTVQREQAAVAAQADAVDGIQHHCRIESGKGVA